MVEWKRRSGGVRRSVELQPSSRLHLTQSQISRNNFASFASYSSRDDRLLSGLIGGLRETDVFCQCSLHGTVRRVRASDLALYDRRTLLFLFLQ